MTLTDDLIIINDFFDDPDKVREKALLCDYDYSEDVKEGWRGYRTKVIPGAFNDPIINLVSKFYGVDKDEYHSTFTRISCQKLWKIKHHCVFTARNSLQQ